MFSIDFGGYKKVGLTHIYLYRDSLTLKVDPTDGHK